MVTALMRRDIRPSFLPTMPRVRNAVPICIAATHDCVRPQLAASPGPPRNELALVYVAMSVIARTTPPMVRPPTK